jgi:hypothetical protein
MSDELKGALRTIRAAIEQDGSPVNYLHDPDGGKIFAATIAIGEFSEVALAALEEIGGWNPYDHSHIEGTEDK